MRVFPEGPVGILSMCEITQCRDLISTAGEPRRAPRQKGFHGQNHALTWCEPHGWSDKGPPTSQHVWRRGRRQEAANHAAGQPLGATIRVDAAPEARVLLDGQDSSSKPGWWRPRAWQVCWSGFGALRFLPHCRKAKCAGRLAPCIWQGLPGAGRSLHRRCGGARSGWHRGDQMRNCKRRAHIQTLSSPSKAHRLRPRQLLTSHLRL